LRATLYYHQTKKAPIYCKGPSENHLIRVGYRPSALQLLFLQQLLSQKLRGVPVASLGSGDRTVYTTAP